MKHTSDLQRIQSRLEEVEGSLARLLNHLPGMAYRCTVNDYDYTMMFVSNGSTALLGLTPLAIMAEPVNTVERMMLPEHLAKVRRTVRQCIESKSSYDLYYAVRLANDQIKWLWDQGEGVYDQAGNCMFLEGIIMDVTEQKTRELSLRKENKELRASASTGGTLGKIVGESEAMRQVYGLLLKAARSDNNVMLYGETGVGKDLAAKTLHTLSSVKGPYIPVNCAAIPEQLLESEFFGHVKGAFSGATANRHGYLAAADKGTLFLDEIGELPVNLQVKLLRALESKTYTPVGASEPRTADFRLIGATNRNLAQMVAAKTMRADFFYRINVLTITLPPLRERQGDLPLLMAAYATKKGITTPMPPRIAALFQRYPWPGNVRELHNALERYWTFGETGIDFLFRQEPPLSQQTLPLNSQNNHTMHRNKQMQGHTVQGAQQKQAQGHTPGTPQPAPAIPQHDTPYDIFVAPPALHTAASLREVKSEEERRRIVLVLGQCSGRMGKAAEVLGISLRTLQRKVKEYVIKR